MTKPTDQHDTTPTAEGVPEADADHGERGTTNQPVTPTGAGTAEAGGEGTAEGAPAARVGEPPSQAGGQAAVVNGRDPDREARDPAPTEAYADAATVGSGEGRDQGSSAGPPRQTPADPVSNGQPEAPAAALPPPWQRVVGDAGSEESSDESRESSGLPAAPEPGAEQESLANRGGRWRPGTGSIPSPGPRRPTPSPPPDVPTPGTVPTPGERAAPSGPRSARGAVAGSAAASARTMASRRPPAGPHAAWAPSDDFGNARTVSLDPGGLGGPSGAGDDAEPGTGTAAGEAGGAGATRPESPPGAFGMSWPRNRRPRQASLQLKRLDPWSVLKIALVLAVVLYLVWMVAVGLLYGVLDGIGVWDRLNGQYADLVTEQAGEQLISAGRVFGAAAVIGAVNSLLFAVALSVAAFVYNVSADLVGGVEVTLSERD